jgi:hypothetical protein
LLEYYHLKPGQLSGVVAVSCNAPTWEEGDLNW